jgi:signal transduction histidine kinase
MSKVPNLAADDIIGYIIDNYTYTGLKGILIAGIMAMLMSTADSYINSSSVLFAHDFCVPLNIEWAKKNELLLSRIAAVVIGVFALIISLSADSLFDIIVIMASFYMPLVTVPLFLAIFGFRTSTKSYLFGILVAFTLTILAKFIDFGVMGPIVTVITIFIVAVSIIIFHYLFTQDGGWTKTKKISLEKKTPNSSNSSFLKYFSISKSFKNSLPKNEASYTFLGLFFIVTVFSTMYSIPFSIRQEHSTLLGFIYHSVLTISAAFLTYPIWPLRLKNKNFSIIFWFFGLFYVLIFTGCLQVMVSNFGQFPLMVLLLSVVVLSSLVSWQVVIFFIISGIILSIGYLKWYLGINEIQGEFGKLKFKITYLLLMLTSILVVFLKPKQDHQEATEAKIDVLEEEVTHLETKVSDLNETVIHYSERISDQGKEIERLGSTAQKILNNVNHELRLPVGNVMNFAEMLNDGLEKLNKNQLKMLSDEVYKNSNRLSSMIMNMLDLATLEAKKIELNKSMINFGELVRDRVQLCRKMYLGKKHIDFEMSIEENVFVNVDPNYMRQTVDNLVINAINFSTEGVIRISALRKGNFVEFVIEDDGIGIPREELYDIFTPFKMGSNTASKAEGRGVGLALCKAALEAHGGSITAESKGGKGARFRFIL